MVSRLAALALILGAAPAYADNDLVVTAAGGVSREGAAQACLDEGAGACPANKLAPVILLGAGLARAAEDSGVRGSVRLEGALSLAGQRNHQVQLLGTAGWQGRWPIVEVGLGSALLWSPDHDPAPAGVFHFGAGVRILPSLSALARADALVSDDRRPYFLGLALEFLPLRAFRGGP